jgi:hypothetical protein
MMEVTKEDIARNFEQLTRHFEQLKEAYRIALATDKPTTWYLRPKIEAFEKQVRITSGFLEDGTRQRS